MHYVRLGNTGMKVSQICLGCMSYADGSRGSHPWALPEEQARPFIQKALEAGINFFDTANAYSGGTSEEILGRAMRDFAKREDVVIATKVYVQVRPTPNGKGLSRKAIMHEVDASLRRLGTDYVDLYQIHRWDDETPIEETLEALNDVVRAGKARYLGASSMRSWQFMKALALAERNGWSRFVSMQPHYNLLYREEEREMLPLCVDQKIGVIPWSPLGRGRLARPWRAEGAGTDRDRSDQFTKRLYGQTEDADRRVVEALETIARDKGVPMSQVALAWMRRHPAITAPIVGATKMHHLDDAIASLEVTVSDAEAAALEAPYVPHPVAF